MQISTIETRTDGLEQSSGGKKDKKDAGGPESAFAAFFAHAHQGARRESTARTVSHEPDAVAEDVRSVDSDQAETQASAAGKQEVKSKQPTAPVNATQHVEADTSGAEETADAVEPESTIVSAPEAKQLRSHVKYSVLPANGKALETMATATDAQVSKAVASALNVSDIAVRTTVKEATAKPVELATTPSAPASTASSVAATTNAAPAVVLQAEVEVQSRATKATLGRPATDAGPEEGDTLLEVPSSKAVGASVSSDTDNATGEDSGTDENSGTHAKVPVSKATSHAATTARFSAKADAPVDVKTLPEATSKLQPPISVPELGSERGDEAVEPLTTASVASKPLDVASRPESPVVRNVTHVVSPDGTVIATQTTETRTDSAQAPGRHDVVVVERTTIQALPEQALRGVRFLTGNGEQTMRIRLVPESLGEVRLEVTTANGEVSVKLASANAAVREILQTHAKGLQSAIAQDGPSVVRVTVTSDVSNTAWLSSNAQRHSGHQGAGAQYRPATPGPYHEAKQPLPFTPRREAAHTGNLNVYA